jgi:dermatan sulfate proteoglycan 3 (PG-Lb)
VSERLSGNRELLTPGPQLGDNQDEDKDEESTPRLIDGSSPQEPEFPGLLGPHTNEGQISYYSIRTKYTLSPLKTI